MYFKLLRHVGRSSCLVLGRPMKAVMVLLSVQKCYTLYNNTSIEQDVDGSDEQCRWCGQGGDLICCDYCHNAICKTCIRRNLGRKELSNILNAGIQSPAEPMSRANLVRISVYLVKMVILFFNRFFAFSQ